MKQPLLILLTNMMILSGMSVHSQNIIEQKATMSKGLHNAFYMELDGASKKDAEKLWRDYLKPFTKKVNSKKGEFVTDGASIPLINGSSALTMDASFNEGVNLTTIYVWTDLRGVYLNSEDHPSQHAGLQRFMFDFFNNVQKEVILGILKVEENNLKNFEKDLDRLSKKNDGFQKDIRDGHEKIKVAELNIQQNLKEQEDMHESIKKQKQKIEKIIQMVNNVGKESY